MHKQRPLALTHANFTLNNNARTYFLHILIEALFALRYFNKKRAVDALFNEKMALYSELTAEQSTILFATKEIKHNGALVPVMLVAHTG